MKLRDLEGRGRRGQLMVLVVGEGEAMIGGQKALFI